MGQGVVTRNSGGAILGEWLPASDADRAISLWHGDRFIRTITPVEPLPNSQARGFRFELSAGLLALLPPGRVVLKDAGGHALPEQLVEPADIVGSATDGGALLEHRLGQGFVVDKWGALKLPFSASAENRAEHRRAMVQVSDYFRDSLGITLFPHYGTLLGLARGGCFLAHDDDVDMSFAVYASTLDEVVDRYLDVMAQVERDGHGVGSPTFGQFHVTPTGSDGPSVDIFLSWGLAPLEFNTFFGVAGQLSTPLAFEPVQLEGELLTAPVQCDEILALTYGPSWQVPDPTFQWRVSPYVGGVMREFEAAGAAGVARRNGG